MRTCADTNNDHFTHVDPYSTKPKQCPWWTPQGNRSCAVSQSAFCSSAHTEAPDGSCHTCVLNDLTNNSGTTLSNAPLSLNGTFSSRLKGTEAARLIARHEVSRPFFLYCAFTVVHDPTEAPAESIARYDGSVTVEKRKTFGGMVWELDSAVGAIADALRMRGMWGESLRAASLPGLA